MNEKEIAKRISVLEKSRTLWCLYTPDYRKDRLALLELGYAVAHGMPVYVLSPYDVEIPNTLLRLAEAVETFSPDIPDSLEAATHRLASHMRQTGHVPPEGIE